MDPARHQIDSLEAGRARMGDVGSTGGELVVEVGTVVPGWLAALVTEAQAAGGGVVVELSAPAELADDERAGWEIGATTAALAAGATVRGPAPARVGRVDEVVRRWEAGGVEP